MGNRLSKIYTRTGDDGTTGLGDGSRTEKDGLRVEAFGTVDELNSAIGVAVAELERAELLEPVQQLLNEIQHHLFDLGGELCIPGYQAIDDQHIERLEEALDTYNEDLPWLKEFILPGGSPAAAQLHLARTICRRAERRVVSLAREEDINLPPQKFLNRLSDLLFVLARTAARASGAGEVLWNHERVPRKK